MALFQNSVFNLPPALRMQTGVLPFYLFGQKDSHTTPFQFNITQLALTSNVATATVTFNGGGGPQPLQNKPQVGAIMGVQGTSIQSGAFNVGYAVVTGVTLNSENAGTITFALTHANVAATADKGLLQVMPYEIPDLVSSTVASAPVAQTFTPDDSDNARCFFVEGVWSGTMPSAASVVIQVANSPWDSRYNTIQNAYGTLATGVVDSSDAALTIAGSAVTQSGAMYQYIMGKFIRAKIASITGADDTTGLVLTLFA